ncbi:MAG: FAD-dependent oxidoreductase [Flavobacteriaceae bacterium]|nr:FAD-dependent oxidoreductase [Flavobacteriaceae bacterium]
MKSNKNIIIVGGGLSGLTLSYFLSKQQMESTLLEASSRLGGRIQTLHGSLNTPLELGATWFSDAHPYLLQLLEDLKLNKYPQYTTGVSFFQTSTFKPPQEFTIPETESKSYRLVNGSQEVIKGLVEKINPQNIRLNTKVSKIKEVGQKIVIETTDAEILEADHVILCLPPQLISSEIEISPKLPNHVTNILTNVQTWMSGSIKFVLEYKSPFWRKKKLSGMLFSHVDTLSEIHDHTNFDENKFGFTGFLHKHAENFTQKERKNKVLNQLTPFFGQQIQQPLVYADKVWKDEFILGNNLALNQAHLNNGHPVLQKSYLNGKLHFAGTESSAHFPGYMEGAVYAAIQTANKLVK